MVFMEKLYTVVFMFNKGLYLNLSAILFVFALDKKQAETKAKQKMDARLTETHVDSGYQVMQIIQIDDCLIIEAYSKLSLVSKNV